MDDVAEEANTESVQAESCHREVQATAGETISEDNTDIIDEDIADVIDEILEEDPDVVQESSHLEELHHMAQKALSAISSQEIPSTGATTYIDNSEREKPPPLSNSFIPYIVEGRVYRDCEEQHCPAGFIHSEKMRLRDEDEEQEEEESDASSLKNKEQEVKESNASSLKDKYAFINKPATTKRKRQRPKLKKENKFGSKNRQQFTSEYRS